MKKLIGAVALAAAPMILFGASAHAAAAANTAQATANVSTTIIQPISVTKNADLTFGTVVKPSSGSTTFTLTASGTPTLTPSGSDGAVIASNTGFTAASFTVSGEGGQAFTLSIPASVSLSGPGTAISVTTSNDVSNTACPSFATCSLSGSLGTAGTLSFHVGGSFAVTSAQATGGYSNGSDLTVTATYN